MTTNNHPNDRKALHAYVEPETHSQWVNAADEHGLSVSSVLEALGPRIALLLDSDPALVKEARQVGNTRRRRKEARR